MAGVQVLPPFPLFTDLDGEPLEAGYIYIGQQFQNPETTQVPVFWDAALTIPAAQPIRTLSGYPFRAGTPASIYSSQSLYSITVRNKNGSLVFSSLSSESATDLGVRLSDALTPSNGAGIPAFAWSTPYPENSIGGALQQVSRNIREFGIVENDGVTNDIAAFNAAAAAGVGVIDARGLGNVRINGTVSIGSGQTWLLEGTNIVTANTTADVFFAGAVNDWSLNGPFSITGTGGATFLGAAGIRIVDCARWLVDKPTIVNMPGYGFFLEPGASSSNRADHGFVNLPRIKGCNIGWKDVAGSGAEYCLVIMINVTGCHSAGISTGAGNIIWNGGNCVDNLLDGFDVRSGSNHAHGIATGMNINHNARYNLITNQVTNGQTFTGCNFYANSPLGAGAIFLDRSKGIVIDGGQLDCWVYNDADGSSGINIIRNMNCPGSYGPVILGSGPNPGQFQLWFEDCFGAGAINVKTINDPGLMYVNAARAPGATQVVGTATQLIFPTENYDRRLAYDNATGVFTVPTFHTGNYIIRGHIVISATAITPTGTYLELRKNGVNQTFFVGAAFSTTKMTIDFSFPLDLIPADTITLHLTAAGTTPVFGDSTYASYLVIERVA